MRGLLGEVVGENCLPKGTVCNVEYQHPDRGLDSRQEAAPIHGIRRKSIKTKKNNRRDRQVLDQGRVV